MACCSLIPKHFARLQQLPKRSNKGCDPVKSFAVFLVSFIIFGAIAWVAYTAMDRHFGWTPREGEGRHAVAVFSPGNAPQAAPTDSAYDAALQEAYEYASLADSAGDSYFPADSGSDFDRHTDDGDWTEPPTGLAAPDDPTCHIVTITLSAAGDTTLGGDNRWAGYHAFMREFENSGQNHAHFLRNISHIFYESDLSIVNLEGTLTYATEHMDKEFVFRGPPHFAQILTAGHVNAVTISNNHTIDFFQRGYDDTVNALRAVDLVYFGNEFKTIKEVNGIKVGLFGYRIWNDSAENRNRIRAAISDLQNRGAQLIIAYYHWGAEHVNHPEQYQINIGRYSIRNGVDLVLGAHPHVIQGIEEYMGRFIVYSLANFSFGGNANPRDQDTFIFQQTFRFDSGVLLPDNEKNVIPLFVSSVRERNDFTPTVAEGADAERILGRIERYSAALR